MGRNFFFNRFHHLFRVFCWSLATILGLGSVVAIVMAISLSAGPIRLDFAADYLNSYITSHDSHCTAKVESAELAWDSENSCLSLQATGVTIQSPDSEQDSVQLPNFKFKFRVSSLLRLKLVPFEVAIIEPHIHLYRGANGHLYLTKETASQTDPENWENLIDIALLESISRLRNVKVLGLRIDVHDLSTGTTWDVPKVDVIFKRKGDNIQCDVNAASRGAKAEGQALIKMQKEGPKITAMDIELNGLLKDFDFDDLDKFWHPNLARVPRTWIMENLSAATVKKADLKAGWHINMNQPRPELELKHLAGEIQFTGMQVYYFGEFPPVKGVDGLAKYNDKEFDIKILKGSLKDIKVTGGRIFIAGMDLLDQTIDIDLDMDGPLETALNILDEKPLKLSEDLDIKPQNVKGHAKGKVHFNFPLESTVTLDKVNYTAKTTLDNVVVHKPLGDHTDTDLQDGKFSLNVDRNMMIVEGKGIYGNIPADIKWQQKFGDHPKDWAVRYDVEAKLTQENVAGTSFSGYTDGPILLKATLTEKNKSTGRLRTELDFTNTRILLPLIQEIHKPGNKAQAVLEMDLTHQKIQKITNCSFTGKGFSVNAKVEFNPATQKITSIDCPNLKLGRSHLDFKLSQDAKQYMVNIRGKSLDLEAVINYLKSRDTDNEPMTPFKFSCDIENAWFHEGKKRLYNLKAKGFHGSEALENCSITGQLINSENGSAGELRIEQKQNGQEKELNVTSNNAGETLDLMGLTAAVSGGELSLAMTKKTDKWTGKLKVQDFHLMEAPAVTRMLSLISPFGILEVVAGKPLAFVKFSTKVTFDKDRILLKQGRAMGPSIGLNVNGVINRKNNTLDLQGTILPYNAINVFLAKVPLVSQLLGGKGGGILGFQYILEGPMDDPTTSVNPLSALTPGILRNVFARPDPEDNDPEQSDE